MYTTANLRLLPLDMRINTHAHIPRIFLSQPRYISTHSVNSSEAENSLTVFVITKIQSLAASLEYGNGIPHAVAKNQPIEHYRALCMHKQVAETSLSKITKSTSRINSRILANESCILGILLYGIQNPGNICKII